MRRFQPPTSFGRGGLVAPRARRAIISERFRSALSHLSGHETVSRSLMTLAGRASDLLLIPPWEEPMNHYPVDLFAAALDNTRALFRARATTAFQANRLLEELRLWSKCECRSLNVTLVYATGEVSLRRIRN
jgi:hypothetical protein